MNHEAWAIPYADLMTLLLAFFVVMYAMSSVNTGKYHVMADALSVAFKADHPVPESARSPAVHSGVPGVEVAAGAGRRQGPPRLPAAGSAPNRPESLHSARIAMRIARAAAPLVMRDDVIVRRHPLWVEVEIRNDVLFASGSASLSPAAQRVLAQLAETLVGFANPIRVEGHTDDVPVIGGGFRDNWDLSAARAGAVVRVLAAHGVDPVRLAVLGFGEHRPIQSNATEAGRRANRRVLLVILGGDAAPTRGRLPPGDTASADPQGGGM